MNVDLMVRSILVDAARHEQQLIDDEIRKLQIQANRVAAIIVQIGDIGERAHELQNESGEVAAKKFAEVQREGAALVQQIRDMRGCCSLWGELSRRHVDQWVKLKP